MTDTAQEVVELDQALNGDGCLEGVVAGIGGISNFSKSWHKYDFRYETPEIAVDVDTNIQGFQVIASINDILESGISNLFEEYCSDLESMVGEKIYVFPNDQFSRVNLSDSRNNGVKGVEFKVRVYEESKVLLKGGGVGRIRSYSNSITRTEKILQRTFQRQSNPNEWLNVDLKCSESGEETVITPVWEGSEIGSSWTFESGIKGRNTLNEFVDELSVMHCLEGETDATAWIKPVWDLEVQELPDSMFISDDDYLAICGDPSDTQRSRFTDKLKRKVSFWNKSGKKFHFVSDSDKSIGGTAGNAEEWYVKQE